jgi:hypothetical protein
MRTRIRINPPKKLMDEFKAEADLNDEEKLENDETKARPCFMGCPEGGQHVNGRACNTLPIYALWVVNTCPAVRPAHTRNLGKRHRFSNKKQKAGGIH